MKTSCIQLPRTCKQKQGHFPNTEESAILKPALGARDTAFEEGQHTKTGDISNLNFRFLAVCKQDHSEMID